MLELRDHLEGLCRSSDRFSSLLDASRRRVAQKSRAFTNVHDSVGIESHKSGAGCVGSYRIVRKHDLSQSARGTVERPVAFHRHNPVRNYEADRSGCAQIKDALLNTPPMENILRPSVSRTRHDAEHVLHTERDARPVMGLNLWH